MNADTTKPRCLDVQPWQVGENYRLLQPNERIQEGDQYLVGGSWHDTDVPGFPLRWHDLPCRRKLLDVAEKRHPSTFGFPLLYLSKPVRRRDGLKARIVDTNFTGGLIQGFTIVVIATDACGRDLMPYCVSKWGTVGLHRMLDGDSVPKTEMDADIVNFEPGCFINPELRML